MFDLSFSPAFFGDIYQPEISDKPKTVADALYRMQVKESDRWRSLSREVFGIEHVSIESAYEMLINTNTCSGLSSPVEVWIDKEGIYTVLVYK